MRRARSGPGAPPRSDRRRMRAMGGVRSRGCTAGRARTLYSAEVTAATLREVAVTTLRPAPRTALILRAPRAGQARAFMVAEADMFSWVFRWCPGVWRARLFGALDFKMGAENIFLWAQFPEPQSTAAFRAVLGFWLRCSVSSAFADLRSWRALARRPSSLSVRGAHSRLGWPLRAAKGPPRATRHRRL